MVKAIEMLVEEHKNILRVTEAIERECEQISSGKTVNEDFFTKVIDFIRNYADKLHHAKEEDILFKEFNKSQSHCNPTEQMLYEHDLGRNFVKGMEQASKENNKEKLMENARGYSQLLQEHIYKEDNILYPMADEALNEKTQKSMLEKFKKLEKNKEKHLSVLKYFEKRK